MNIVLDLRNMVLSRAVESGSESSVRVCCKIVVISKQFSVASITASAVEGAVRGCSFTLVFNSARCHCMSILQCLMGGRLEHQRKKPIRVCRESWMLLHSRAENTR